MTVEVLPIEGLPEIRPGDDLDEILAGPIRSLGLREGDVLVVTQKIVSKAEGRLVIGEDRTEWIERETRRVVARRGDLVIAETSHGFVCANAGVDASNVDAGVLALLPEDPDASAERLRAAMCARIGVVGMGVVITDTFGRPWRQGLVNVAIGCAGMPAVVDLRGEVDHTGRELEATIVALADEVAAAAGLVMGKSARIPAAIVRGVALDSGAPGTARDLIRPADEDLFRESALTSIFARRSLRSFGSGGVPRASIEEAVRAAFTAPAPQGIRPWRFTVLESARAKDPLLRAIGASEPVLTSAPVLIVPWVSFEGARAYDDAEHAHAEQELFLLSCGAAIQSLLLALHAQGVGSCWLPSPLFRQEATRAALETGAGWFTLGIVAAGPMPEGGAVPPRPPVDLDEVLDRR